MLFCICLIPSIYAFRQTPCGHVGHGDKHFIEREKAERPIDVQRVENEACDRGADEVIEVTVARRVGRGRRPCAQVERHDALERSCELGHPGRSCGHYNRARRPRWLAIEQQDHDHSRAFATDLGLHTLLHAGHGRGGDRQRAMLRADMMFPTAGVRGSSPTAASSCSVVSSRSPRRALLRPCGTMKQTRSCNYSRHGGAESCSPATTLVRLSCARMARAELELPSHGGYGKMRGAMRKEGEGEER